MVIIWYIFRVISLLFGFSIYYFNGNNYILLGIGSKYNYFLVHVLDFNDWFSFIIRRVSFVILVKIIIMIFQLDVFIVESWVILRNIVYIKIFFIGYIFVIFYNKFQYLYSICYNNRGMCLFLESFLKMGIIQIFLFYKLIWWFI